MHIKSFENAIAWQKAKQLVKDIYADFRSLKDYNFRNQIFSAAVSIMNNIAEGFERNTNKEFKNFLYIAKGSCGEVRSMLYLALKFKYISKLNFTELYNKSLEISKLLSGFIKTL